MDKVVKYVRVPVKNQKEILEEQQKELMQYAEEKGFEVAEVGMLCKKTGETQQIQGMFADEGTTLREVRRNNKVFKQMLEEAMQGKVNQIIIKDIETFAKVVKDGMKIIRELRQHSVNVHFMKEGLDTIDIYNDLLLTFSLCLAEREIIERSEIAKKRWNKLKQNQ